MVTESRKLETNQLNKSNWLNNKTRRLSQAIHAKDIKRPLALIKLIYLDKSMASGPRKTEVICPNGSSQIN